MLLQRQHLPGFGYCDGTMIRERRGRDTQGLCLAKSVAVIAYLFDG